MRSATGWCAARALACWDDSSLSAARLSPLYAKLIKSAYLLSSADFPARAVSLCIAS